MKELQGQIIKKVYANNSKSEHLAVIIQTLQGDYLLRRVGGNAFNDEVLNSLVGNKILGKGEVRGNVFFINQWTIQ